MEKARKGFPPPHLHLHFIAAMPNSILSISQRKTKKKKKNLMLKKGVGKGRVW